MTFEISIDIGGTFTDLYVWDSAGESESFKVPTTTEQPTEGIFTACEKAADAYDCELQEFLARTDRLIHGTTIATNAIIEGEVDETALITTAGFKDTLTLREGGNRSPYEWDEKWPEPYIPRWNTFELEERISPEGTVIEPLDEGEAREIIAEIRESDVDAVAVSLLWAHVNPEHETVVGELLEELAPEIDYSVSHRVNPIIREYRRTSSTAINASLFGPISEYLSTLKQDLAASGYDGNPLIISANGGVMGIDEISRTPIWIVDSGPTMLPVAARHFTRAELDESDVIAVDMGGTSLDISTVTDGTVSRTREAEVSDDMLGIEKVDVQSIGSGGGSIAWVDEGGLLRVGPQSAGSDPGPVCYGNGGERPTVTDAAVVLGYLNEDYFLGGEMTIDRGAAAGVISDRIGAKLDLDTLEAAYAIYATANQDMVNGIKEVTIDRGIDPKNYVMAGGGGALGVHAVQLARELKIDDILLPHEAGVVSSIGGIMSDIRRDFSGSCVTKGSEFDHDKVNSLLSSLESKATEFFSRSEIAEADQSIDFYTEARYPHQVWELEMQLPFSEIQAGDEQVLIDRFHEIHDETYGFEMEQDVEFLYWRVDATGHTGNPTEQATERSETGADVQGSTSSTRTAYFDGEQTAAPAFRADDISTGYTVAGPAFIDAKNTTIVLPPDSELRVTERGNYHIKP